jgi:type IV pilus assembly protein PilY1
MRPSKIRALSVLLGACYCLTAGAPVYADDTEIFGANNTLGAGMKPNILFIIDTSGSMDSEVVSVNKAYDPATTYSGSCDNNSVYWRQGDTGAPPDCGTDQHFPLTQQKCKAAATALGATGRYVAVKAAMWNPGTGRRPINQWREIRAGITNQPVECAVDANVDGDGVDTSKLYARDGDASNKWTDKASNQITWSAGNNANRTYVMYNGNYMNWYYDTSNVSISTRLNIVKQVVTDLMNSVDDVNVGLMRYSSNTNGSNDAAAEGGMVTHPVTDIATSRQAIIDTVNSYNPDGWTPLSETLYEAGQYLAGRKVDYGLNSQIRPGTPFPSVPASRVSTDQSLYQTPLQYSCQKTSIVYLTDGEPTQDNSADAKIIALPNFGSLVSATGCDDTGSGRCLDDMAEYLFKADLNPNLSGTQNAITYTIGFGPEVVGSTFLEKVAQRGGGKAYSAGDYATLSDALTQIVTNVVTTNTTFTSPSVSVNAFNRTQTLDDLYVSVFRPSEQLHWPGNVKKYRVTNGEIVDARGDAAIENGFFKDGTRSYWSGVDDGSKVDQGGAASKLPAPDARNVYTNLGVSNSLTDATNAVAVANATLTDALLGLGSPGLPPRADLIEWVRGRDTEDDNNNQDVNEPRLSMGDPIHSKPAILIYGGSAASPDVNDAVVFAATNDGYLHAVDVTTGQELWSFIPRDLLASMPNLFLNAVTPNKHYGLDGDIRVFKIDRNSNGVVEKANGDRVLLFFGMRRGGSNYYALDVTEKKSPQMLWTLGAGDLPALGQTWSTPTVAKVNISSAPYSTDNATDKFVLIFAGGYEDSQDNEDYNTDATGNRIYMVDPFSGALLWTAGGNPAATPINLNFGARMNNSMPADVLVLDTNQDGFADRMYAVDTGGRIWRFDITNGQTADQLVAGGIIASLGAGDLGASPPVSANRRFYSAPDATIVRNRGSSPYLALVVGSGFRGHPLNVKIRDRLYMIKDMSPFAPLTQAQYNTMMSTPTYVKDSDLIDVTDNLSATIAANDKGWKLQLREGAGVWIGEKSLSQATIFNNRIFFTTYIPQTTLPADPCTVGQGSNRAWAISLFNGAPVENLDGQAATTRDDRHRTLEQGGIAPEVVFLFPGDGGTVTNRPLLCLSGVEVLAGVCVNAGAPVRTFWQESGMN